ncbi:DUF4393 domain-containing protein [Lentibacillus saliphilus]|uniref:DUF4393 domain-containing protein n=1 Tax=Lentibacillus saliphilus TaxID=2737028 RepID=UPI001C2FA31C|nr:DUF4393 domain-containing protein [Lentibacillus saliphilus]
MYEIITSGLMTFGAGFATSSITKAQGPGRALDDIMALVGFEKLHEVAEKKREKREQNVKNYKESIAQKIASIPEEKLQEPPLSLVGPALEASKYYIEEETLREMFSNLIASSMNSSQSNLVHTSYVDIIRQLSPHDAHILKEFKKMSLSVNAPHPIMSMVIHSEGEGTKTIFPMIALFEENIDFFNNAPSINNLERLGIIKTSFTTYLHDDNEYNFIRDHHAVKSVLEKNKHMTLKKGSFVLTNFGENFISICVENSF